MTSVDPARISLSAVEIDRHTDALRIQPSCIRCVPVVHRRIRNTSVPPVLHP